VPPEEALIGERLVEVLCGVEHHLDHALDIAVGRLCSSCVEAEAAGNR